MLVVAAPRSTAATNPLREALRQRVETLRGAGDARIGAGSPAARALLPTLYEKRGFAPLWAETRIIKLLLSIILVLIFCPTFVFAGTCGSSANGGSTHCTGASPWASDTSDYVDVNYCVNTCATYGNTVTIPAGTSDWSSELVIEKYMTIQGNGIDSTIITNSGIDSTLKGIMRFTPGATSRAADGLMRFTGLTLKNTGGNLSCTDSSKGILIGRTSGGLLNTTSYFNIRIDHCSFYNFGYYGRDPKYYGASIAFYMMIAFGLVDNCSFYGPSAAQGIMGITMNSVGETYAWVDYPVSPGTKRALYVEDCHFENFFRNISTGNGARQVFRFNETESPKYDSWANTDAHGNFSAASLVPYFLTDRRTGCAPPPAP